MKYADVKIEKIAETVYMFKTMAGEMCPIRVEVDEDYFKAVYGPLGIRDEFTESVGVPIEFVAQGPYARIIIADDKYSQAFQDELDSKDEYISHLQNEIEELGEEIENLGMELINESED